MWDVFVILVGISAVLLSGHGADLIADYNAATKEEIEKYDKFYSGNVKCGRIKNS